MPLVTLRRNTARPLVDQIVEGIIRAIDGHDVRPGAKLPSIRNFAKDHGVSRFTVVDAYDRLVAQGYLSSRRGSGFYAIDPHPHHSIPDQGVNYRNNEEVVWLIRRLLDSGHDLTLIGGPWLPRSWLDEAALRKGLRHLAGQDGDHILDYGHPAGFGPLREQIAEVLLPEIGIKASPSQILLTTGASQALDLVIRHLLKPGDAVLVDDPGYYNLFGNLRASGIRLISVPRGLEGPGVDVLEAKAAETHPKLYFTQSVLQNPTGTSMSPAVTHRVLQAAVNHDFLVVEDDIFSDLSLENIPRLATLDQLSRVIYLRSFSKTLSGSMRVGFIASSPLLIQSLTETKMVTSITTSLLAEKLIHQMLTDGHYRKLTARLRTKIGDANSRLHDAFDKIGITTIAPDNPSMFLWGRYRDIEDSLPIAEHASHEGLLLAPGTVFRPSLQPSPWMRFNVAVCDNPAVLKKLKFLPDTLRR